jgi:hypothetical protein
METQVQTDVQPETVKEEIREKTREEIVEELTENLLNSFMPFMKGPITEKVNEFMSTMDKRVNNIVVKCSDKETVTSSPIEESGNVISSEELRQAIYKDIL